MSDPAPTRAPSTPAVAASLVLLRDGDAGIEVFCIERRPDGRPDGGVVSFPGGRVEIDDLEKDWHEPGRQLI
jgi:8-oxo-dGTP pyrophosphatase MutT (NUDIX family)